MVKFVAPICLVLGLIAFAPAPAQALPVTGCADNGSTDPGGDSLLTCNLVEATSGEQFSVVDPFGPHDWFTPSYTLLLDAAGGISDVVKFFAPQGTDTVALYSVGAPDYAANVALALAAPANALIRVQEAAAGLATTFFVNFQSQIGAVSAFAGCNAAANCDTINVYSDAGNPPPPPPPTVPEPATLTLLGIGGAVAAIRRRMKATA